MSWLTPIGFLGLLGLVVLLIIYLIKPNFQQKFISTTYVWKLSLKYKKKKIPLSKLRNILIIICQVLIVTTFAFILAQPFVSGDDADAAKEKIIIIDASVSMYAELEDETRFERAVMQAAQFSAETFENGGTVSVILAGRDASILVRRQNEENAATVNTAILGLIDENDFQCTYGNGDIDGAIALSETILEENPKAEVILYTGTRYIDDGKVTVMDISDVAEWNAAILDLRAVRDDNYYRFELDIASYARSASVNINIEIHGANGTYGVGDSAEQYTNGTVKIGYNALLEMNKETTVTFGQNEQDNVTDLKITSYDHVYCYIQAKDSLDIDNTFYLYGGKPQPLRVQYYSTQSNVFVDSVLKGMRDSLRDDWDMDLVVIQDSVELIKQGLGKEPELEGFDIYIFEHTMPKQFPTDGLVIIINPDKLPKNTDFVIGNSMAAFQPHPLEAGTQAHPLLDYVNPANINILEWQHINTYDSSYTPILSIEGDPVVLAKNEPNSKMLVFAFSLHYSDFVLTPEFPMFMNNVIKYYVPTTFEKDVLEIYDTVTLNSRSDKLKLEGPGYLDEPPFTEFPVTIEANAPGIYTVTQTPISGQQIVENFFVTIPSEQSNIVRELDSLTNPYYPPIDEESAIDFVFYFAMLVCALLFIEWWLKSRENN